MKLKTFTGRIGDGDIRLLRIFCAVVRCGGFAAAESELPAHSELPDEDEDL